MDAPGPDAELVDDVVGVASARLRAAGISADERILAMRLLSVLLTLADGGLRVRRPLPMVASEFDLPLVEARRSFAQLVDAGVVREAGGVITLVAAEQQRGGFTLHDFLDAVDDLDRRRADRQLARRLRPAAALVAAAATIAALTLVVPGLVPEPSTPVSTDRDLRTQAPATTGREGLEGPATTSVADGSADPAGPHRGTGSVPAGSPVPGTPGTSGTSGTGPSTTEPAACPGGVPLLELTGTEPGAEGTTIVQGVVRNRSTHGFTVRAFSVSAPVGGQLLTVPASAVPLTIPPGGAAPWSVVLPVATTEAPPTMTLDDWEWDPPVPVACPSP